MLAILAACVLAVCAAIAFRWQSATMAFGRAISPEMGARGMQDAITPAWLTRLQLAYMLATPVTLVLGWLAFAWYWGIALVVAALVASMLIGAVILPGNPLDERYRRGLVRDLERRHARYQATGDAMRAQAMADVVGRMRGSGAVETPQEQSVLTECERAASSAVLAYRRGEEATAALGLLTAFMRARDHLPPMDARRAELTACGAAALTAFWNASMRQRAGWNYREAVGAFPLDNAREMLCEALQEHFPQQATADCDQLIRAVGEHSTATAFSIPEIQRLMREEEL